MLNVVLIYTSIFIPFGMIDKAEVKSTSAYSFETIAECNAAINRLRKLNIDNDHTYHVGQLSVNTRNSITTYVCHK